jgi:hypothetical protein
LAGKLCALENKFELKFDETRQILKKFDLKCEENQKILNQALSCHEIEESDKIQA